MTFERSCNVLQCDTWNMGANESMREGELLQPFPLDNGMMYPMVVNDVKVWECHIRPFVPVLHNVCQGPPCLHSEVPVKKKEC